MCKMSGRGKGGKGFGQRKSEEAQELSDMFKKLIIQFSV